MTFGERLKSIIDASNLTQAQLAERAGLSQQVISKLVTGSGDPQWSTVCAIAAALDVSTEEFRPADERVGITSPDRVVLVTVEVGDDGGPMKRVAEVPVKVRRVLPPPP